MKRFVMFDASEVQPDTGQGKTTEVRLVIESGPSAGREITVRDHQTFVVGRAADAHVRLSDSRRFSRYHCRFEINPPSCRVTDLNSTNGTLVNGRSITSADLCNDDVVVCGDTRIAVSIGGQWGTPLASEHVETVIATSASQLAICPTEIAGYEIKCEVGRGGMGVVYQGVHRVSRHRAAIKLIVPQAAVDASAVRLFLREASTLSRLRHPRIVEMWDFGLFEHQPFIAMEYVDGIDILDFLAQQAMEHRIRVAAGIACRILEALDHAHQQGIVHRDVKPSNILAFHAGRKLQVKLADFGLAKNYLNAGFSGVTGENDFRGTLAYMPPEQLIDCRYAKPGCDIYAAGVCLYRFLSNGMPIDVPDDSSAVGTILHGTPIPIRKRCREIPGELSAVVHRALQREPSDRFASAEQMRQALLPFTSRAGYD